MYAILGLDGDAVRAGCAQAAAETGEAIEAVNFNDPKQTVIAGSKADTKLWSDMAYKLSTGPKEYLVVDGATHIAMYDTPDYVDQAITAMVKFFAVL